MRKTQFDETRQSRLIGKIIIFENNLRKIERPRVRFRSRRLRLPVSRRFSFSHLTMRSLRRRVHFAHFPILPRKHLYALSLLNFPLRIVEIFPSLPLCSPFIHRKCRPSVRVNPLLKSRSLKYCNRRPFVLLNRASRERQFALRKIFCVPRVAYEPVREIFP